VTAARAAATATVPGNVAAWVASAKSTGTAAESMGVDISVHMALRDTAALKAMADAVSKPGNPAYGHYLTPAAFRLRFAPDTADVTAVVAMLKTAGMTQIKVGAAGAYVFAHASVAQLRSTFGISQNIYTYAGKSLRANREAPSIPAELAGKVLYIEGLDDTDLLRTPLHRSINDEARQAAPVAAKATPDGVIPPPVASGLPSPYCSTYIGDSDAVLSTKPGPYDKTLPWLNCGYTPQQIQQAYGLTKVKYNGTGITVAILDAYASPTLAADGNQYATNHKLPALTAANFSQLIPAGIYDVSPSETCGPQGWFTEQSLDLASVHGAAPGATIVYIGARDCGTSLTDALLDAIYNEQANILTNSYSFNGESIAPGSAATADQAFMTAAAQGQTVMFSSGDDGDLSQDNGIATGAYESTSAYVTGVGGTSLLLANQNGGKTEYGWGTNRAFLTGTTVNSATSITTTGLATATNYGLTYYDFSFYSGSGGGISLLESQPSYQVGVVPATLSTYLNPASGNTIILPNAQRVSPDVAMDADPYTGYLYGETFTIAGNGYSDAGCVATSSTTEYCEAAEGGTSLASPLFAGMMAVVDQARKEAGKPLVGFANPWLYGAKIGSTMNSAGINDIKPPAKATAVLRGYPSASPDAGLVRVVTINSVPFDLYLSPFALEICGISICEGIDDVFSAVTPGYDDVTGLGVPYAPLLVKQ
jgi:subtilase family serine protease